MEKWKLLYSILGLYKDNGKQNGNYYIIYWENVGIMKMNMETTTQYIWGYVGIRENKMGSTIRILLGTLDMDV